MESWIEFGRGPMFRLSFVLMTLGLLRIFVTAFVAGMNRSIMKNETSGRGGSTSGYAGQLEVTTTPISRRPLEAVVEIVFHLGVIIVPLFVAAHVIQWHKGAGFGWWELPQPVADNLTILVIILAPLLAGTRIWRHSEPGSTQASLRPLFVAIPFVTGYICVNGFVTPTTYYTSMLIHVWTGNLLMLALGFSSLADLVIVPVSDYCDKIGWRFGRFAEPIWQAAIGNREEK